MTSIQAQSERNSDESEQAQSSLDIMQADMQAALEAKRADTASEVTNSQPSLVEPTDADGSFDEVRTSRIIEMAWEDRTPFAAIEHSYGLNEAAVIDLMRRQLKPASFRLWRERVTGRHTKHEAKRDFEVGRAYAKTQYKPR